MNEKNNVRFSQKQAKRIWHYFVHERIESMKDKNKSIKSTMRSWIMLSDEELDNTKVYMEEQEKGQKKVNQEVADNEEDALGNAETVSEDGRLYADDTERYSNESNLYSDDIGRYSNDARSYADDTEQYSDTTAGAGLYSDNANLYSDNSGQSSNKGEQYLDVDKAKGKPKSKGQRKLSRDEEINQLTQEVGQEVIDKAEEDFKPRRRRKRRKDKKAEKDRDRSGSAMKGNFVSDDTIVNKKDFEKSLEEKISKKDMEPEIKSVDFSDTDTESLEQTNQFSGEKDMREAEKIQKTGGMSKILTGGIGILLVLIIGGLGYQNQSLQKQNARLKTQVSSFKAEKKKAEKASEEQALQTKNEDGVVENTDKMFASVKVGDKEYKLLSKVSDFTKDGWKLEALRTEDATLVPGGKLEKDAFLTNTEGKKIGVIIRNMSDKNQKVSDCIITKLSFSKEMFDGNVTLPKDLGFSSTEKELKAAGFKKDADGAYCYTSKKIKDDTIKMTMADGESVSDITLERAVDESAADTGSTANASATTGSTQSNENAATGSETKGDTAESTDTTEPNTQGNSNEVQ